MTPVVVDTNVPITANGDSDAGPACVIGCTDRLQQLVRNGHVVLDILGLIMQEYRRYLRGSGQPSPGDAFLKWLWTNQWNEERCTVVTLTPVGADQTDFEEFPHCEGLENFDPADRKFVAVANAQACKSLLPLEHEGCGDHRTTTYYWVSVFRK
jgi:hypothetical protein